MQRLITVLLVVVFLSLVILWMGCSKNGAGGVPTPVSVRRDSQRAKSDETLSPAETSKKPTPDKAAEIPDWFLNPPENPNYLYAAGTESARDLQTAFTHAGLAARSEIASQIQVKVSTLFKRFREEAGIGEDAEINSLTASISKAVLSESLNLSTPIKRSYEMEGIKYRAYVLMEMPIGRMNAALMTKIKGSKDMYTQFRASQAFKELEEELEKQEQLDKE